MAGETTLTITGSLTADPELRFLPTGVGVASFTVASNARKYNKETDSWEDEPGLFMPCSVWRDVAERCAECLTKGDRVIVTGRLRQRSYETKSGEKRTVMELQVDEIGASLKWASVKISKATRSGAGSTSSTAARDPWITGDLGAPAKSSASVGSSAAGYDDEPPF